VNSMESSVSLADLQTIETQREAELEEARELQQVMLPKVFLQAPAATIGHEFHPIAGVGGDFLDYFEMPDGMLGLFLGDVSGKGLPAALYAALAVGTLRGVHKTNTAPSDVLTTLNRRLMIRGVPRRHASLQYAVFDPSSRRLTIAGAGMAGPVHMGVEGCSLLELPGVPPGLFAASSYETVSLQLRPRDSLLFFTDGVGDAFNTEDEQFGMDRVLDLCKRHCKRPPVEVLHMVFAAVNAFAEGREQHDDMTAVMLHVTR
jgi:sigma-B regulation protein RsbU (phosphoserine phosphatase)